MYRGRLRVSWDQTTLMYLLHASINTPKNKRRPRASDVHPLHSAGESSGGLPLASEEGKMALKAIAQQYA